MLMVKKGFPDRESSVTEEARRATGVTLEKEKSAEGQRPDPEVSEKPKRRTYSAAYKLKILKAIDRCAKPGEIGALIRREGLYSSVVAGWRRQRERGELAGLAVKKRGRKAKPKDPRDKVIEKQQRKIKRLEQKLQQAETVIDIQKKVSQLLGIPLKSLDEEGSD